MRYYSEDTVRRIIRIVVNATLEQSSINEDYILKHQPNTIIKESTERLKVTAPLSRPKTWDEDWDWDRDIGIEDEMYRR